MVESAAGLLLTASDLKPIYVNAEATQILAYPEMPKTMNSLDAFLIEKLRSVLHINGNGAPTAFAVEFISGRRSYLCRAFALNSHSNNNGVHPALAVILERSNARFEPSNGRVERGNGKSFDASQVAAEFHLTSREQETLRYLTEGLTNKEIGQRMNISPNTVKAFLELIMMKMGVSTRSGIIGKAIALL